MTRALGVLQIDRGWQQAPPCATSSTSPAVSRRHTSALLGAAQGAQGGEEQAEQPRRVLHGRRAVHRTSALRPDHGRVVRRAARLGRAAPGDNVTSPAGRYPGRPLRDPARRRSPRRHRGSARQDTRARLTRSTGAGTSAERRGPAEGRAPRNRPGFIGVTRRRTRLRSRSRRAAAATVALKPATAMRFPRARAGRRR
jgi:hypothetical protein